MGSAADPRDPQTNSIVIEVITPVDYEAANDVVLKAYRQVLGKFLDPGYASHLSDIKGRVTVANVYVARIKDTIVGCVTYVGDPTSPLAEGLLKGEVGIRMLGVDPSQQRLGIGRRLATHCVEMARQDGANAVFLYSTTMMNSAHRLYESLGFLRVPARDILISPEMTLLAFRLAID